MKRIIKNWDSADYMRPARKLIAFYYHHKLFVICNQCNYLQTDIPRIYGNFSSNNHVPQVVKCCSCNKIGFACYNDTKINAATCGCGGKFALINAYTCPCCHKEIDLDLPKPISPLNTDFSRSELDNMKFTCKGLAFDAQRNNCN